MLEKYSLFIFLALISEIVGTISGFGSSILFVPVASLFFDFKTVLGITTVFHVFSNLSKIALFRKGINRRIAVRLGVPAVIFVLIGAWITTIMPTREIELYMNIILVLLSVYMIYNFNANIKSSDSNLYVGGALSGLLAGIVGTGGAIRGITLSAFHLPKEIFIATSALVDLGVDMGRAAVYISYGYFETEFLALIPFLILISFAGSYLGKIILKYTTEKAFRILVLTSVLQMVKYFSA